MARIRTIKPEFASDEKLARVSRDARLTFVLAITQADDDGLLPGNHRQLLAALYPLDDAVNFAKLSGWIEELVELGRFRWRETIDGSPILEIVNWSAHQKVDHKGKSLLLDKLKPVGEESPRISRESREEVASDSRSDLGPRTVDLGPSAPRKQRAARVARPSTTPPFVLAPYLDAYLERFPGAQISAGHLGKVMKALEVTHGPGETLTRWRVFLAEKGTLGPDYFARTWSEWAPRVAGQPAPSEAPRQLRATEMILS